MSAVITFSFVWEKHTTRWFKYKIDYIFIINRNKWYTSCFAFLGTVPQTSSCRRATLYINEGRKGYAYHATTAGSFC
ncbi:hypothetical protein DA718_09035 [Klebsiella huaxiensis]|nr:hypothetical protein DA718_09035 [Klebsiella huaxiensis]